MNKIKLTLKQGVWIASVVFYNVEVICTAACVRGALRGLKDDMYYIEHGLGVRMFSGRYTS